MNRFNVRKSLAAIAGLVLSVFAATTLSATTVYCYSCCGPSCSSGCEFNGRKGTWGKDVIIDGVTFHTCELLLFHGIEAADAFTSPDLAEDFVTNMNWSPWFNSDNQGGVGDYELLKGLVDAKKTCANPIAIDCRAVKGEIDWRKTQQVYHCDLSTGGYCVNREQAAGKQCEDYKVRFLCP